MQGSCEAATVSSVVPGRAKARARTPFGDDTCGPMDSGLALRAPRNDVERAGLKLTAERVEQLNSARSAQLALLWKYSKIFRALSALTPGTLPRSAIEARSISFSVPK